MKIGKLLVLFLVIFTAVGFALGSGVALVDPPKPDQSTQKREQKDDQKKQMLDEENPYLDLTADVTEQRSAKDSTIYLVGNVAFHHNGAIIQCDSAARYTNSDKMDFFGRVIIYKDSAYIYGDKVSYDAETDMAEVFAPLVKMVRGDVTLYSYNLRYNTKTNIAYFVNGGVMTKQDNVMESFRGEFNADANLVKFIDSVSMRSKDYDIKTDSLQYSVDDEVVTFLTHTYIWDKDSSIMEAYKGFYFTKSETYEFFDKAYILTKEQEMWADTMNYYSPMRQATMMRNVQVLDTVNKSIAFGDWAFYDDSLGVAILTKMPSVRSYDDKNSDTTYMRSDTIFVTTYEVKKPIGLYSDSLKKDSLGGDSLSKGSLVDSLKDDGVIRDGLVDDSVSRRGVNEHRDSILRSNPSAQDHFEEIMEHREEELEKKIEQERVLDSVKRVMDSLTRAMVKDSLIDQSADSVNVGDGISVSDSIAAGEVGGDKTSENIDSLSQNDSIAKSAQADVVNDTIYKTTKEKIIRAYYNVRMWSKENQSVCDSMIAFSADSTAQMHGSPVIWNESSQIAAEEIYLYSANEELDWVEFIGDPFITQKVEPKYVEPEDSSRFNQAKGRVMNAYFKNNEIDSVVLSGNVINYYFMESDGYTNAFAKITCADLVVFFENRKVSKMRWEDKIDNTIYPIDKIPADQSQRIEGFTWQQDRRPKSAKEISDRELKQSRRSEMVSISKPVWTIEERIEQYKKVITQNGTWTDRTDVNTITVDYFESRNEML